MRCSKCEREGAYIRLRTKQIVCRYCGNIENIKQKKGKKTRSVSPNKNKGKI